MQKLELIKAKANTKIVIPSISWTDAVRNDDEDTSIEMVFKQGVQYIRCTGFVPWHTDIHLGSHVNWSALLVYENQGVGVRVRGEEIMYPEAGDIILLAITKRHKTVLKPGAPKQSMMFCKVVDFDKKPTKKEIIGALL